MHLKSALCASVSIVVALTLCAAPVHAVDASCVPLIRASTPDPARPYKVSMTMVVNGKTELSEAVYIDGFMYIRHAGAKEWLKMPMPDIKSTVEMAEKSLSSCSAGGIELVGGTPTRVWTSKSIDPFSKKPMAHKVWIGIADNRVYRQKIDDVEQLLSYSNVAVPSPVAASPAERRRKVAAP